MKTALCYCRVSTKEQADSGYSLEAQEKDTVKYARSLDYEPVVISEDVSGSVPMDERPKGRKIRELVQTRQINAIVVYCVDRLSRELVDMLVDARYWLRSGIKLYFVDKGEVKSENDILFIMQGWQSTDEKKKIVKRLSEGRRNKASKNHWVGCGTIPYGYTKTGALKTSQLIINQDEAEIVRWIFDTYIGRNGQRLNLQELADKLNAEGIPAPGFGQTRRGRSSGWWKPTLQKIIRNRVYIGRPEFGEISMDLPGLAIIDNTIFDLANEQLRINFLKSASRRKFDYLLAGEITCSCGRPMYGATNLVRQKYTYKYYRCVTKAQGIHTCPAPALNVDQADKMVWDWILTTLWDEAELERGLIRMDRELEKENQYKQERLSTIITMLDKVSGKINKLMKAFQDETDEFLSESYQDQIKQLALQRKAYQKSKDDIEEEISRNSLTPQLRKEIIELVAVIKGRLGEATFKNKRRLFEILGLHVTLMNDQNNYWLDITCRFSSNVLNGVTCVL